MWLLGRPQSKSKLDAEDKLRPDDLVLKGNWLLGQSGIPTNTDSCAYEPIQRLLAIATSDGRVKIMGSPGVEKTVRSRSKHPYGTSHLQFLYNRGVLVRVSEAGFMEAWSICSARGPDCVRALTPLRLETDNIMVVASMPRDAYVLLGCTSGALRIAALVDANDAPVTEARLVKGFALQAYRVTPDQVKAEGPVIEMAVQSTGAVHRVLMVHKKSGLAVWDIRSSRLVAHLNPRIKSSPAAVRSAGSVMCAAWIGTRHGDFASGHAKGDVFIWAMPDSADTALLPTLLSSLRVVAGPAEAVRSLRFANGRRESLLVVGGQERDEPDSLMFISLPSVPGMGGAAHAEDMLLDSGAGEEGGGEPLPEQRIKLPWFGTTCGYCLVSAGAAISGFEDPAALIQLVEGGQMVVHDLEAPGTGGTQVFSLPFQAQPAAVTAACAVVAPTERPAGQPPSSLCVAQMRKLDAEVHKREGRWAAVPVVVGGVAPSPSNGADACMLYLTGHSDGHVRVWDLYSDQPMLLATAPSPASVKVAGGASLKAVTALELVWEHGILLTGHRKGEVRMYQWSDRARSVQCTNFDRIGGSPEPTPLEEPPGFQLKLRSFCHSQEVRCVKYSAAAKAVAVGDKQGGILLIDISRPAVLWYQTPGAHPVTSIQIALAPWPSSRQRSSGVETSGQEGRTLFLALADSTIAALDCRTGLSVGRAGTLKPKSASVALLLEVLDDQGRPLWMSRQRFTQADLAGAGAASSPGRRAAEPRTRRRSAAAVAEGRRTTEDVDAGADDGGAAAAAAAMAAAAARRRATAAEASGESSGGEDDGDDEDMDVDEMLARAAQEMDLQGKGSSKRGGAGGSGKSSKPAAEDTDWRRGGATGSGNKGQHSGRSTREDLGAESDGAESTSSEASGAGGSAVPGGAEGVAALVLLVSDVCLRIYDIKSVMVADRATVRKVDVATPLLYARTFHVGGAPALVVMSQAEGGTAVKVFSLPGLHVVHEVSLSQCVGSHWQFPEAHASHLSRLVAVSDLGHLLLLGEGHELLQVALAAGLPQPLQPTSMYDWELAAAAHAASLAYEQAQSQARSNSASLSSGNGLRERAASAALAGGALRTGSTEAPAGPSTSSGDGSGSPKMTEGHREAVPRSAAAGALLLPGRGLGVVFSGLNKALTGTGKGIVQLGGLLEKGVKDIGQAFVVPGEDVDVSPAPAAGAAGIGAGGRPGLPDLASVFSMTVPESQRPVVRMKSNRRGAYNEEEYSDEDDDGDILEISDDDIAITSTSAAAGAARGGAGTSQPTPSWRTADAPPPAVSSSGAATGSGGTKLQYEASDDARRRDELLDNPKMARSASAIKRHYRPNKAPADGAAGATGASQQIREVVDETRRKLNERGERLKRLDEKTGDLESSAAGFADMARQIAERERNKKWWQ